MRLDDNHTYISLTSKCSYVYWNFVVQGGIGNQQR